MADTTIDTDVRDLLLQFLRDNQLPESLITFITTALGEKKSYAQILTELRQTPEYKAAYPENDQRIAAGFDWWSEAQIREYRSEARRLASEYFGASVSNEEIATMISKNKSLTEYEHNLQIYKQVERWGPTVKTVLAQQLGYVPDDQLVYRFLDHEISTPELDRAYETALYMAQPASIGLGIRPEEEADILRAHGISVEQAFQGYQGIVNEMPRSERLGLIEAQIGRNEGQFPTADSLFKGTTFAKLFNAIQLGDPAAMAELRGTISREVARWQGRGGVATDNSGASVGLLSEQERRQRS